MNLRRKLTITFGALAFLGLLVAAVSAWTTLRWESSNDEMRGHYARSLEAQRIRAAVFRATKEVPDAVAGDSDARREFEGAIAPVSEDFETWAALADTDEERRQVERIRSAYAGVVEDSRSVFDLVEDGRRGEAARIAESSLEEGEFRSFERLTDEAVASDREMRGVVRDRVEDIRRTAQIVLLLASFGTVSLLLLLAAYLASDLFRPLRELENALGDVAKGDLKRRLDAERADEIGGVERAFNRMVEAISRREHLGLLGANGGERDGSSWREAPSRVTLHRLVSRLRTGIVWLGDGANGDVQEGEIVGELDRLSQAVARMTEFGFPLDLNLSRTDVRALLYGVFMRHGEEFADRAVSIELQIAPEVGYAVVDRLKLREAVGELLKNALSALPETGGHLGLRSRLSEDGSWLVVEVADDGQGTEQSLIDEAFDPDAEDGEGRPRLGLALTAAIVEQHGGDLAVESIPSGGTYARIRLPVRD